MTALEKHQLVWMPHKKTAGTPTVFRGVICLVVAVICYLVLKPAAKPSSLTNSMHVMQWEHNAIHAIVGHYQCHGRPAAVEQVLLKWRQVYPHAPVFMVNDGGDPALHAIALRFGAHYSYNMQRTSASLTANYVNDPEAMIQSVERILVSAHHADYIMIMEDDVHVLKPITLTSLQYDLNSDFNPLGTNRLDHRMVAFITSVRRRPPPQDWQFGGCGGSILRGAFLREMQRQGNWRHYVHMLHNSMNNSRPLGHDEVLSALLYAHDGSFGPFPGFAEKWYKDYQQRLAGGSIEVVHQVKDFYNATSSSV